MKTAEEYYARGTSRYDLWEESWNKRYLRDALKYLTRAIELKPDYADAYHKRSRIYRSYQVFISWDDIEEMEHDLIKALELYKEILKRDRHNPLLHYGLGLAYSDSDNCSRALRHLRKALEYDPSNPEIYAAIGDIYRDKKRQFKKALDYYDRAIELEDHRAWYYLARGECLEKLGKFESALGDFAKGRKCSWSSIDIQKPKGDMLSTSAREMCFPAVPDFIFLLLYYLSDLLEVFLREAIAHSY